MKGFLTFLKNNLGFIIILFILAILYFVKVPYEIEMPGGVIDLSDRVKVDGKELNVNGSFNMAYVQVAQGSLMYYLLSFVVPDWEAVKVSDVVYNDQETIEDANKRDLVMLEQSKNEAMLAALETAKLPYEIVNEVNNVIYIDEKADTDLKIGDHIMEVDGISVSNIDDIINYVKEKEVGDKLSFKVTRDKKLAEAEAVLYDDGGPKIGIMAVNTFDITSDKKITIESQASESGPSGGMMMALMIYNGLTGKDLTKGKKIVGTGTISRDGTVGEIGGVKYKLMGAVKAKADVFLVPEGNYEEATKVAKQKKYNIAIVKVGTLQDAIEYLEGA